MRLNPWLVSCLLAGIGIAHAQEDFTGICHASSSYDLTVKPQSIEFDRPSPARRIVAMHAGKVSVDGVNLRLNTEDGDRAALFEDEVRALVPKAKTIADRGVDLVVKAIRSTLAQEFDDAGTRAQFDRVLDRRSAELKRRIADSTSTHDWQGDAFDRYTDQITSELAPLVTSAYAERAAAAAREGDLGSVLSMGAQRGGLIAGVIDSDLAQRLASTLAPLRPQIQALCPSLQRLADLQRGVRGPDGKPLDLIGIDGPRR
jgi:hypothetical protein